MTWHRHESSAGRAFRTAALVCLIALQSLAAASDRPNILFLFSDDQRADTIHALGNPHIQTPNLDRLVRSGTTFRRAYCMGAMQGAVCVPSRAMLMTGRSLFRATAALASGEIPPNHPTLPEVFRKAGYETIGIGKWHNDRKSFARGFSKGGPIFFGGMTDQFNVPVFEFDPSGEYKRGRAAVTNRFSTELFAGAAIHFLSEAREASKPFFMYVAFTVPHDPRTPPGGYSTLYRPANLPLPPNFMPEHPFDNGEMNVRDEQLLPRPRAPEAVRIELANYYGMITHLDSWIGKILERLEQLNLARQTIVVFASDHGLAIGSHGLLGKQNLYEHSVRSPVIMAGPGIPRDERSDALCYLFDLNPTLCELAGLNPAGSVEGKSLVPVLKGQSQTLREEIYCAYRDVQRSVRNDRLKLIHYPKAGKTQLFDLKNDPDELHDLSSRPEYAAETAALMSRLKAAEKSAGDPAHRGED